MCSQIGINTGKRPWQSWNGFGCPIIHCHPLKAFFSLFNQALIPVVAYLFLSDSTRYAMDTLKRSILNCYFVYHSHAAPRRRGCLL